MKLLGIELSSAVGSVALTIKGETFERTITTPREQHGKTLMFVDELLKDASLRLEELDGVAFGRGPGSFTGLRIAAAHAQGLSRLGKLPIFPVSSMLVYAQGAYQSTGFERALVCIDARMGQVFVGSFAVHENSMVSVADEVICAAGEVERLFADLTADCAPCAFVAVGDGFVSDHGAAPLESVVAKAGARLFDAVPAARDLFPQAVRDSMSGRVVSASDALPIYLREANAWRRF